MTTTLDTSTFIAQSVNSVMINMIIGFVLAMIVLQLFLQSVRTTLVIGLTMPLSLLTTFTLMYLTGESINTISMGGLAIGIGLMIDSGIVILENIFKKRQEGLPMKQAALEGATELTPSVVAATLTTAVIFVPLLFTSGLASQLIRPLAFTVVFAVTAALIGAITFLPMLSSKLLGNVKTSFDEDAKKGLFNRMLDKLTNRYVRVIAMVIERSKKSRAHCIGNIVGSLALIPLIGFVLMPASDNGEVQITVELQSGTQLEQTEGLSTKLVNS